MRFSLAKKFWHDFATLFHKNLCDHIWALPHSFARVSNDFWNSKQKVKVYGESIVGKFSVTRTW